MKEGNHWLSLEYYLTTAWCSASVYTALLGSRPPDGTEDAFAVLLYDQRYEIRNYWDDLQYAAEALVLPHFSMRYGDRADGIIRNGWMEALGTLNGCLRRPTCAQDWDGLQDNLEYLAVLWPALDKAGITIVDGGNEDYKHADWPTSSELLDPRRCQP